MTDHTATSMSPGSPTYQRLLEVAATLFRAKGFVGTTTRELASSVGIQNASVYYHIRSKSDLLHHLCIDSLTSITEAVQAAVAADREPLDQLRSLIVAHVTTSLADQDKHATMLTELRFLPANQREEVVTLRDRYEAIVCDVIGKAQQAGSLRSDIPPRQLTLALLNLLNWTIFWFHPGGILDSARLAATLSTIYLDGAGTPDLPAKVRS